MKLLRLGTPLLSLSSRVHSRSSATVFDLKLRLCCQQCKQELLHTHARTHTPTLEIYHKTRQEDDDEWTTTSMVLTLGCQYTARPGRYINTLAAVGTPVVDVPVITQPAFSQSVLVPGSVPRQSVGHSSYATVIGAQNCGGSAVAVLLGVAQCLFRQMICISSRVASGRNPGFLREGVDSAPEVDSRLLFSEVAAHIADNGSGMYCTGFAGIDALRAVFPTIALS